MQFVSQLFRSSQVSNKDTEALWAMHQVLVDHEMDRFNRPLEQIINEGSHGEVENKTPVKSQTDLDYELMVTKFNPKSDIIVMSPERLAGIMEAHPVYPIPEGVSINEFLRHIIVFDGVMNIGIIKS